MGRRLRGGETRRRGRLVDPGLFRPPFPTREWYKRLRAQCSAIHPRGAYNFRNGRLYSGPTPLNLRPIPLVAGGSPRAIELGVPAHWAYFPLRITVLVRITVLILTYKSRYYSAGIASVLRQLQGPTW